MNTSIIKRNDTLEQLLKHWNHNNPSNIGMGRLSRKLNDEGIYLISKTGGRQDLTLFNISTSLIINGEIIKNERAGTQLSFEPTGINYRDFDSSLIKAYVAEWVEFHKEEIYIQLHYLNWFNSIEIVNFTLEETIKILESYKYNQEVAEVLFKNLSY
jgi:hypothetical protein